MSSLNVRDGEVEIYEFSRGFSEVRENGKWISGGFGNAIDRSNYGSEIPASIQQFINNNQNIFGIPTGFAPATKQVALIARVIDTRYCVLAVANYQGKDNKSRDGIVGYRYFWLDRNSETNQHLKLDGVGTLLNWWLQNSFVFDMNPDSFTREKLVCNQYIEFPSHYNINSNDKQDYPIYPAILALAEYNSDNPLQLHAQVLEESEKAGLPLAWAWNVRQLNFPEMYVAIFCENENAKQRIERELERKAVSKVNPIATKQREISKRTDREYLNEDKQQIDKKLDDFVREYDAFNEKHGSDKAKAIVEVLCNNKDLDWNKFFVADNQHIKHLTQDEDPQIESIKYYALLPLLIPEGMINWLNWLREKRNQKHTKISVKTQNLILDSCSTSEQKKVVIDRIYDGISIILNEILYGNQQEYKLYEWLLISHKENLWSKYLNKYVAKVVDFLNSKSSDKPKFFGVGAIQDFLNKLSHDFSSNEIIKNKQKFRNLGYFLYKRIKAEVNPIKALFNPYNEELLKVNLLSAICYQFSGEEIPNTVLSKLKNEDEKKIDRILNHTTQEDELGGENSDVPSPNKQNQPTRRRQSSKSKEPSEMQARVYQQRKQRDRFLLVILALGLLIALALVFPKLYSYLFQSLPNLSNKSLNESITKCNNMDINTAKYSEDKQDLQRCKAELKKLLITEINKISVINENKTSDDEKNKLRNSPTYLEIRNSFINSGVALKLTTSGSEKYKELDQHILSILNYLKQSLDDKTPYREIFIPLEKCAKKNQLQDFSNCIQSLPLNKNKR